MQESQKEACGALPTNFVVLNSWMAMKQEPTILKHKMPQTIQLTFKISFYQYVKINFKKFLLTFLFMKNWRLKFFFSPSTLPLTLLQNLERSFIKQTLWVLFDQMISDKCKRTWFESRMGKVRFVAPNCICIYILLGQLVFHVFEMFIMFVQKIDLNAWQIKLKLTYKNWFELIFSSS